MTNISQANLPASFVVIGPDLDMSSEQFNSALLTGAYPPQISQYNQMSIETSQNLGYNYYSTAFQHVQAGDPSKIASQPQYYSTTGSSANTAYVVPAPPTFQTNETYPQPPLNPGAGSYSTFPTLSPPQSTPGIVRATTTTAATNTQSVSAAGGFPPQSDQDRNFGMGLYLQPQPPRRSIYHANAQ